MQSLLDVPAPAKLNLFLHVTGRRQDGYHLLQSVFVLIDWCDTLHFERRSSGALSREDLSERLPADDLCMRAARALQQATGTGEGAHIRIDKRIPSQAGMGGGSSDAASCLLALNRLWRLGLTVPELSRIGLGLGSDVPFFLAGHNAWVEGVGERITPIEVPRAQYLVAKPPQGLATDAIFRDALLKRNTEPAILAGFAADPFGFGCNDLQAVAQRLCPGIPRALSWFTERGLQGRMTGSGSAVFAVAGKRFDVGGVNDAPPDGFQVRWCSGVDVHPLWGWASSDCR